MVKRRLSETKQKQRIKKYEWKANESISLLCKTNNEIPKNLVLTVTLLKMEKENYIIQFNLNKLEMIKNTKIQLEPNQRIISMLNKSAVITCSKELY